MKNLLWNPFILFNAAAIIKRNSIEFHDFLWIVKYAHLSTNFILLLSQIVKYALFSISSSFSSCFTSVEPK